VDPLARHQVHIGSENLPHSLLERYQIEQGKAFWLREVKEHIDVGGVVGLVAGNRAEEKKGADPGIAKFRLMFL